MSVSKIGLSRIDPWRPWLYRGLHVLVPLLLIGLVVVAIGADDIGARLRHSEMPWLLAAMAAAQVQIVASAFRWRVTAAQLGAGLSVRRALGEYYLSGLVNMTVPGGVVGDAARAFRSREAAGFEAAAQAVVIERMAGQIALALALTVGLILHLAQRTQFLGLMAVAVGLALICGLGFAAARWGAPARLVPPVLRRFGGAMRQAWTGQRVALFQVTLSLIIVAANIATFAFAAVATGTPLGLAEALFAIPLILAAMLIPLSVGGWGYREGAAALIFPVIGLSAAAGVGASVVFGAVILLANLPALAFWLVQRRDPARS